MVRIHARQLVNNKELTAAILQSVFAEGPPSTPAHLTVSLGLMKYRSDFNVIGLIRQANKELAGSDPAAYMIFLLAVTAGLRRKEIDLLEWRFH
jgi:hypothetical protein